MYRAKNEAVLPVAQRALQTHPGNKGLRSLYVTYGNSLDALKRTPKALQVYAEGIAAFPDFYALYFKPGHCPCRQWKTPKGAWKIWSSRCCSIPTMQAPTDWLGSCACWKIKRVPAVLALSRFLVLEPQGARAKVVLEMLQKAMNGNVKRTGENQINISLSAPPEEGGKKEKGKRFWTGRNNDEPGCRTGL